MEELLYKSIDLMTSLTPAQWCQSFFGLSTAGVLLIQALPRDVRSALTDYGARRPSDKLTGKEMGKEEDQSSKSLGSFLKNLAEYGQVPHSWFLHFYIISVFFSGFWAWQYITGGSGMKTIAVLQDRSSGPSMSLEQVFVVWLFMALQGLRRLYESLYVFKQGSSPMWFVHWALGISYYVMIGLSVWVEGSKCLVYLAIAWVAAPPGQLVNKTVSSAIMFAAVNLGATANGTKTWYADKFGADKVAGRWIMLPPVF
ncbi:hypothetical protein F66182_5898 [Fusarium sp. NRRL 66182]|nr:hypothetical protein F66182_5898 [Fusarium sp. NRRL 66182]